MRRSRHENHEAGRAIGFVIAGLGLGAGLALLLAPDSGEEIRHAIGRRYRRTIKTMGRRTEGLRDRAEDLLEHAHDLRERGARLLNFAEAIRRRA